LLQINSAISPIHDGQLQVIKEKYFQTFPEKHRQNRPSLSLSLIWIKTFKKRDSAIKIMENGKLSELS
jgi:hypothetical protein